ncbi:hypothetical protein TNCV_2833671 [Trichonephila clavipes]|nr:hypothetical protein TNCV_2833671 [Trichonephila clavipes]
MIPSDSTIPFKRLQFPIRLAFAMSINKSQAFESGNLAVKHRLCSSVDRLVAKAIARLRTGYYRGMKIDTDGRKAYRNCDNCSGTELTLHWSAIFAALHNRGPVFVNRPLRR